MPAIRFHPPFAALRGRVRAAPAAPSAVILVVPDRPRGGADAGASGTAAAIRRAAELAGTAPEPGPVTVIATVRIHGSGLGVPHPGLLPTPQEREQGEQSVRAAVAALQKLGVAADGQIVITRNAVRAIARAARNRGARTVVVGLPGPRGLRGFIEGDLAAQLRRRLRAAATVESS
jgi:nucleotide-binding universal stress UspA family protein